MHKKNDELFFILLMQATAKVSNLHLDLTGSSSVSRVSRYGSLRKQYHLNLSKGAHRHHESTHWIRDRGLESSEEILVINTAYRGLDKPTFKHTSIPNISDRLNKYANSRVTTKNSLHISRTQFQRYLEANRKKKDIQSFQKQLMREPQTSMDLSMPLKLDLPRQDAEVPAVDSSTPNGKFLQQAKPSSEQKHIYTMSSEARTIINNEGSAPGSNLLPRKKISRNNIEAKMKYKPTVLPQIRKAASKADEAKSPTLKTENNKNIAILARDMDQLKCIKAESFCVMEVSSGNLIVSQKGTNGYEIASLTKIMTFYCVRKIQSRFNLNIRQQKVVITDHAMQMTGTSAQIATGEIYTIQNLLFGLMLPSGNDAAIALAIWGGNLLLQGQEMGESECSKNKVKAFVEEMNNQAKDLGLLNTKFANPHGLPHPEAKSTAVEVAKICVACLQDPMFRNVVKTQNYECQTKCSESGAERKVEWMNTNKLLRRPGFIGIKTGITVTAGPCLATAYQFRSKTYVVVVLRANKVSKRFKQTRRILSWTLSKLFQSSLSPQEKKTLLILKRTDADLDSDYSEQEQEFNYELSTKEEFEKRCNIIKYEM